MLPSWPLCCIWHHRPQHPNHSSHLSSWFGKDGSVLCSFKSYLSSSLAFRVTCDNNLIPCIRPFVVFPKALFPFPWPPPLCKEHSAVLFPSTQLNSNMSRQCLQAYKMFYSIRQPLQQLQYAACFQWSRNDTQWIALTWQWVARLLWLTIRRVDFTVDQLARGQAVQKLPPQPGYLSMTFPPGYTVPMFCHMVTWRGVVVASLV